MTNIISFPVPVRLAPADRSARAETLEAALEALEGAAADIVYHTGVVEDLQEQIEDLYKALAEAREGKEGAIKTAREARAKAVRLGAEEDDLYEVGALYL